MARESNKQEPVEIDVDVIRETDGAIFIDDGKSKVWIPKVHVLDGEPVVGEHCTLTIPYWMAHREGLI